MTGDEHYRKAEQLLAEADALLGETDYHMLKAAQVHATLAHAAATARLTSSPDYRYGRAPLFTAAPRVSR